METVEGNQLKAARYVFGPEPKDQEVLEFVKNQLLALTSDLLEAVPVKAEMPRRINPKRLARQAARELAARGVSTYVQAALKLEYEHRKKERQLQARQRREEQKEQQKQLARQKAKAKRRGG